MIIVPSNTSVTGWRYIILDVSDVRGTDFTGVKHFQLAEFTLRATGGSKITGGTFRSWNGSFTGNSASNTGYSYAGEEAAKADDGNTTTKYNDNRTVGTSGVGIWIDLGATTPVTSYEWTTANDWNERDMTAWNLYGSNDNTNWTPLSTVAWFSPTMSRYTLAGTWSL